MKTTYMTLYKATLRTFGDRLAHLIHVAGFYGFELLSFKCYNADYG